MRLFLGVELEAPLRADCAAAARELAAGFRRVRANVEARWIPEENLHVTLWFLGNQSDERLLAISKQLAVPVPIEPFALTIAGAGAFPPSGPARILWLGIDDGAVRLRGIYGELARRLAPLGFEAERRPYHPHITIARVKQATSSDSRKARDLLASSHLRLGPGRVESLTLFQSRLSPGGARYEALLRVPLKGC